MGKAPAVDEARLQAWKLLRQIEKFQAFADLSLDKAFALSPHLRPLDRAFIFELVLGTLRWQGRIDRAIQRASKFPQKKIKPQLLHLLRLGAYQILFLDRVPESAAVNESVRLAKAIFQEEKTAGFVNAILRSITAQKGRENFPPFAAQPLEHIAQAFSHPRWLVERWLGEYGPETTLKICQADNLRPPITIRVNTQKTSRESLSARFKSLGLDCHPTPFAPEGLILKKSPLFTEEHVWPEGEYCFQDEASQIIAHLLGPQSGELVLDACAAPGGKTTHIAQLMEGRGKVVAMDLTAGKINFLKENCRRMGTSIANILRADASQPLPFPAEPVFDRILVDAPCTGLGTLHRNPEIKWRRKPDDALRLSRLQTALLENVCSSLKSNGVLVYSTCTMTREENDSVIAAFLDTHKEFQLEDLHGIVPNSWNILLDEKGFFRTYPQMIVPWGEYRLDGFFAARMRKGI